MIATDVDHLAGEIALLPPAEAVSLLLDRAARMRCSDLFFASNEGHFGVLVRHLGVVRPLLRLSSDMGHRCISHIKAMAAMDLAERRRPQDGRWIHELPTGGKVDLRINILPTMYGEDCSLRLLVRDFALLELEQLGFVRRELNDLPALLNSPSGLLLVTGPTGSGKTTTLYGCLRYLNNGERKINTIEDPIEYGIDGVRQSQINPRIDLGFPELLRSVLRQAPDVIMIGEIRDPTTAAIAVHAANSGHLVLATAHAPVAAGAIQTLRAWGISDHFLATSLLGIIAQRLVRTLCPDCRTEFPLTDAPETFAEVKPWLQPGEGLALFSAGGCSTCHMTGYVNRTGVFEVMRMSTPLRRLITEGQPTSAIQQQAIREGMMQLRQAALLLVAQGVTTAEEVVRAVSSEYLDLE
jgi:type II secretory ATPase GspE/PulE/Tfp pilus assembly ATPase PilB-like protein